MSKVKNIETYNSTEPTVVTIGTFDGVHIGHQKIIKRLINTGKLQNLKSVILTFFPHPRMVLQKDSNIKLINTIDERSDILDDLGLDYLLIKEFTKEFSRLSAEDFVKQILVEKLHAKKVIIGYDHRFGRNRNADINDLKGFGETYGFEVEEISVEDIDDVAVSSTKIRNALNAGDIAKANSFLGYNFMLNGKVVKPTVNGEKETIEVHFFDFKKDIYDQKIQINLLERIRDEQKFESIEDLKTQLQKDKETALRYIKNHHA